MSKEAIDRVFRVLDQMLTMHASLRDEYRAKALLLDVALIVGSVFLCGFTFSEDGTFITLGVNPVFAKAAMGFLSLLLLTLSILQIKIDWKGPSEAHQEAFNALATLKPKLRALQTEGNEEQAAYERIEKEFGKVTAEHASIPERHFARLKAKHLFKIELSKRISEHPKSPLLLLKLGLRWEGMRQKRQTEEKSEKKI